MSSRIGAHTGYLLIDHRDSPGIPEELAAKWKRMGVVTTVGSTKLEADTFTCGHCQRGVIKEYRSTNPRNVCRKCMRVTCRRCALWCTPFEQIAEQQVKQSLKLHESGLLLPAQVVNQAAVSNPNVSIRPV